MAKEFRGDNLYGNFNQPPAPQTEPDTLQQNLNKVDATAATFNRTAAALDYHNIINIAVFLLFIVVLLWILKSVFGSAMSSVWEFFKRPFVDLTATNKAKEEGAVTQDMGKARNAADALYACFSWSGDDEDGVVRIIQNFVQQPGDWSMLKTAFGTQHDKKMIGIGAHDHDLEGMLVCNLTDSERAPIRRHLNSVGITANI